MYHWARPAISSIAPNQNAQLKFQAAVFAKAKGKSSGIVEAKQLVVKIQ
jgi:hypothetical protein